LGDLGNDFPLHTSIYMNGELDKGISVQLSDEKILILYFYKVL
jgi:hypothetical protein